MDQATLFSKIQAYCLAKPEAYEDHPWEETVFKVAPRGKIFCFCGRETPVITVKATLEEQAALIQLSNVVPAAYVGRYGWVTVTISDEQVVDLALELIDRSYAMVAGGKKRKK